MLNITYIDYIIFQSLIKFCLFNDRPILTFLSFFTLNIIYYHILLTMINHLIQPIVQTNTDFDKHNSILQTQASSQLQSKYHKKYIRNRVIYSSSYKLSNPINQALNKKSNSQQKFKGKILSKQLDNDPILTNKYKSQTIQKQNFDQKRKETSKTIKHRSSSKVKFNIGTLLIQREIKKPIQKKVKIIQGRKASNNEIEMMQRICLQQLNKLRKKSTDDNLKQSDKYEIKGIKNLSQKRQNILNDVRENVNVRLENENLNKLYGGRLFEKRVEYKKLQNENNRKYNLIQLSARQFPIHLKSKVQKVVVKPKIKINQRCLKTQTNKMVDPIQICPWLNNYHYQDHQF